MATFSTTVGDSAANSYATVAEADDYLLERRLHAAAWSQLGTGEKEAALMWACRALDDLEFIGSIASETQALQWPRVDAYTADGRLIASDVVPAPIKDAQAEIAFRLVPTDKSADPTGEKYEKVKVGPLEFTLREPPAGDEILEILPPDVRTLIRRYLKRAGLSIPVMRK